MSADYPRLLVETRDEWRQWLEANHSASRGVWLVTWKKSTGRPSLSYDDLVEEALAFGWVDSQPKSIDDVRSARLLTPRKPTSNWSRLNKQRVARLTEAGLMRPSGMAAIEAAKASGRWSALDDVEDLTEPADLAAALDAVSAARTHWDAFPRSTRRAILEWIGNARTDATRRVRISRTAHDAASNVRANQWRQPKSQAP